MQKPLPLSVINKSARIWNENAHLTYAEVARKLGINRATLQRRLEMAAGLGLEVASPRNSYTVKHPGPGNAPKAFEVAPLPDDDLPIEEIVAQRKREFRQKKAHEEATRLIPIKIKLDGPVGILHFGDPHVDDDGTDIETLERHSDLTKQEGIFGANVGDTTNNWIGRLARLYAHQNVGRSRAVKLAEWFVKRTNWLYMVGGNHDAWSGEDDPIRWISKLGNILYRDSEVRVRLTFPKGEPMTVNARHDFAGGSQWNPTHGPMKAAQLGVRDDLFTCGHKHKSGYGVLKDPDSGRTIHAIQVGSYKIFDRYAKDKGFRDQSLGPACLTVLQPGLEAAHPDRIKAFWDPEVGAEYLRFLRRRR